MALVKGDITASGGMAKTIYDKLQEVFLPAAAASGVDMDKFQETWQKLAYAIASGVIDHITTNMGIKGITTKGGEDTKTTSDSANGGISHSHNVPLKDVVFTQNNDGTGHVE
jgi:hypothetical protein